MDNILQIEGILFHSKIVGTSLKILYSETYMCSGHSGEWKFFLGGDGEAMKHVIEIKESRIMR